MTRLMIGMKSFLLAGMEAKIVFFYRMVRAFGKARLKCGFWRIIHVASHLETAYAHFNYKSSF